MYSDDERQEKHFEENAVCLLDNHRGIYIPQNFAEGFDMEAWHVEEEDAKILQAGPEQEYYWDTWDSVTSSAYLLQDSKTWRLHQGESGDLFVVPDMEGE